MSQVISIFRAAMAQRAQRAVNPHKSGMAPSSAFDRLMADDAPLFDSTPTGMEWSGYPDPADPDNYWIDDATGERVSAATGERFPARVLPEEC